MPAYINENQVAFDVSTVGFPKLGHCMGIAIEFPHGLYGFHHSSAFDTNRVSAILSIIQGKGDSIANAIALYGSCRFGRRYPHTNGRADWEREMREFAAELGRPGNQFRGHVYGFDLSSSRHVPRADQATETAYMEIVKNPVGPCTVRFKRMSKMTSQNAATRTATAVYPNTKTGASAFPTTTSVSLDPTKTKSATGVMHTAKRLLHFIV
jgi:hypothetical protein